jgi:Rrf2 family transcriptional regulator, iron-sulfur cluster assembly transcription factor
MFSRSSGYAIQALIYLAQQPLGRLTGAREIAAAAQIPKPFLWKILRNLSQKKLLRSFKGVRGGYEMARAPGKITIAQILEATRGDDPLQSCILRAGACDDQNPCPLHDLWKNTKRQIERFAKRTTLADIASAQPRARRKGGYRGS